MMAMVAASNLSEGATLGPHQLMCWPAHLLGFWEAAVRFSVRRRSRRIGSQAHTGFLAVTGTVSCARLLIVESNTPNSSECGEVVHMDRVDIRALPSDALGLNGRNGQRVCALTIRKQGRATLEGKTKAKTPCPEGTGNETIPREIEPSDAAPRPDDRELEAVAFNAREIDGRLQTTESGSVGIWPELRSMDLDPNDSPVEGWVAGFPVVDGVADSGWQECEGGRLRLIVKVPDCPGRREWARGTGYGGTHAKEVLG